MFDFWVCLKSGTAFHPAVYHHVPYHVCFMFHWSTIVYIIYIIILYYILYICMSYILYILLYMYKLYYIILYYIIYKLYYIILYCIILYYIIYMWYIKIAYKRMFFFRECQGPGRGRYRRHRSFRKPMSSPGAVGVDVTSSGPPLRF